MRHDATNKQSAAVVPVSVARAESLARDGFEHFDRADCLHEFDTECFHSAKVDMQRERRAQVAHQFVFAVSTGFAKGEVPRALRPIRYDQSDPSDAHLRQLFNVAIEVVAGRSGRVRVIFFVRTDNQIDCAYRLALGRARAAAYPRSREHDGKTVCELRWVREIGDGPGDVDAAGQ